LALGGYGAYFSSCVIAIISLRVGVVVFIFLWLVLCYFSSSADNNLDVIVNLVVSALLYLSDIVIVKPD